MQKQAAKLKIGDVIPAVNPLDPLSPEQVVTGLDYPPGLFVRVTTAHGSWVFGHDEYPRFPLRTDRVTYDWAQTSWRPKLADIAIGDVFAIPNLALTPDDEIDLELSGEEPRLRVVKLSPSGPVVKLSLYNNVTRRTITVSVTRDEDLLPHRGPDPSPATAKNGRQITRHGPYVNDGTGKTAFFLHKPYAGRWPRGSQPYSEFGEGEMRAPRLHKQTVSTQVVEMADGSKQERDVVTRNSSHPNLEQWRKWRYDGPPGGEHPYDIARTGEYWK